MYATIFVLTEALLVWKYFLFVLLFVTELNFTNENENEVKILIVATESVCISNHFASAIILYQSTSSKTSFFLKQNLFWYQIDVAFTFENHHHWITNNSRNDSSLDYILVCLFLSNYQNHPFRVKVTILCRIRYQVECLKYDNFLLYQTGCRGFQISLIQHTLVVEWCANALWFNKMMNYIVFLLLLQSSFTIGVPCGSKCKCLLTKEFLLVDCGTLDLKSIAAELTTFKNIYLLLDQSNISCEGLREIENSNLNIVSVSVRNNPTLDCSCTANTKVNLVTSCPTANPYKNNSARSTKRRSYLGERNVYIAINIIQCFANSLSRIISY